MIFYWKHGTLVRSATEADATSLQERVRREDVEESRAAGHESAAAMLDACRRASTDCRTLERDGVPVAMFGLVPQALIGLRAFVWLVAQEDFSTSGLSMACARAGRAMIADFLTQYPVLWGVVRAGRKDAGRWVEFLGAKFDETPSPFMSKLPYRLFFIERRA